MTKAGANKLYRTLADLEHNRFNNIRDDYDQQIIHDNIDWLLAQKHPRQVTHFTGLLLTQIFLECEHL